MSNYYRYGTSVSDHYGPLSPPNLPIALQSLQHAPSIAICVSGQPPEPDRPCQSRFRFQTLFAPTKRQPHTQPGYTARNNYQKRFFLSILVRGNQRDHPRSVSLSTHHMEWNIGDLNSEPRPTSHRHTLKPSIHRHSTPCPFLPPITANSPIPPSTLPQVYTQ